PCAAATGRAIAIHLRLGVRVRPGRGSGDAAAVRARAARHACARATLPRRAARAGPVTLLGDRSSTPLKEGLDLMLRRDGRDIATVDAPVKAGDFGGWTDGLITAAAPVLLAIDQPADRELVLSLDGRTAVRPWMEVTKPDGI